MRIADFLKNVDAVLIFFILLLFILKVWGDLAEEVKENWPQNEFLPCAVFRSWAFVKGKSYLGTIRHPRPAKDVLKQLK